MTDSFRLPPQPVIYEINTAIFLSNLSKKYDKPIKLGSVPDHEWAAIAALPVDVIWLMGVWERSPYSRKSSMDNKELRTVLPDFTDKDNLGSSYSIRSYEVDTQFGGHEGLAKARTALRRHGLGLILDFVPNHIACDHEWVKSHPEYLIHGTEKQLKAEPEDFHKTAHGIFAHGKDPEYPAWSDVLQLNAFSEGLRTAVVHVLDTIAKQCDGVRCDMAMLLNNPVFALTWGSLVGPPPLAEYWPTIIGGVRKHHPDFVFIAEVYWDWERRLLTQGFDYCYDKTLYDDLAEYGSIQLYHHLHTDPAYQAHLLRFIENHDEPRAAKTFALPKHKAAAFVMATVPGATMYHQGELAGYKVKLPVHLGRSPAEEVNQDISEFYSQLIATIAHSHMRVGEWQLCRGNNGFMRTTKLMAWTWLQDSSYYICVVNYNPEESTGHFELPSNKYIANYSLVLGAHEIVSNSVIFRDNWMSVRLRPWGYAIYSASKA
jgi:glycosidase